MPHDLRHIINAYDPDAPLARAATIPAAWYTDPRILVAERQSVFSTWQCVGRTDQLTEPGRYLTATVAGEPVVVVRGEDNTLRAFYNVCRHHAAAVMTADHGRCSHLRCPYHGWTYGLDGALKGTPEFDGVETFAREDNGLIPVTVANWENFVFIRLAETGPDLQTFLGDAAAQIAGLDLASLQFFERRSYTLNCNWKVYIDNYLDGGYHVPFLHKGLNTVLDYAEYKIENGEHFCLQSSPIKTGKDDTVSAVRRGDRALYYWFYPNFMLNWYQGVMDTNLVRPLGVDRCEVIFDFYFDRIDTEAAARNRQSVDVGERIQQEDIDICESVQRGLNSRAYDVGRLSVRREAGEHLFHRLLHRDLSNAALG